MKGGKMINPYDLTESIRQAKQVGNDTARRYIDELLAVLNQAKEEENEVS
jgi:hypothetical protein